MKKITLRTAALVLLIQLTGCSTYHTSKEECERANAGVVGGAVGFLGGSAFGNGWGTVGASALGTVVGNQVGKAVYDTQHDPAKLPPARPYYSTWYGECRPIEVPAAPKS